MNKVNVKDLLKKFRDFLLCCKRTINDVESIIEDINDLQPTRIYNL